jgi:hypothetical protein
MLVERYGTRAAVETTLSGSGHHGRRPLLNDAQRRKFDEGRAPLMITEFGGTSYASEGNAWGYTLVTTDEGYRDHLTGLFSALRSCPDVVGFCYTQLTDTLQETNGLLTADREPKLSMEVFRAIVTGT